MASKNKTEIETESFSEQRSRKSRLKFHKAEALPQRQSFGEAFRNIALLLPLLLKYIVSIGMEIDGPGSLSSFSRRTYYLIYILIAIPSYIATGIFTWLFAGAYMNATYLSIILPLSLFSGIVVMTIFQFGIYFMWRIRGFTQRKIFYLKHIYIWYVLTPLTWIFYPLTYFKEIYDYIFFTSPVFFFSLVLTIYLFVRVLGQGLKYFRKQELFFGLLFSALPYFAFLYYMDSIAARLMMLFS